MIALLALLIAGPGVTAADAGGRVSVWRPETGHWTVIHRCLRPPVPHTRIAWAGSVLFIACPGEAMARWEVGDRAARPVTNRALALRRPVLIGGGPGALFFAEDRAVWRYRPDLDLLERIAAAPEWPLAAVVETPVGLLVRGRRAWWQWRRGHWRRLRERPLTTFTHRGPTPRSSAKGCSRRSEFTHENWRTLCATTVLTSTFRLVSTRHAVCTAIDPMDAVQPKQESTVADRNKAVRILAKSIFRELTAQGFDEKQIVSLATALLNEVTVKISGTEASPRS